MPQAANTPAIGGAALRTETRTWGQTRNEKQKGVDWQFTTDDARIKLKNLYPQVQT